MYSVKPIITDVSAKIKPADVMYHVERIFKGSLANDQVATSSGDIVQQLTNLENKIDEKIALRRLNTLETKLDGLISKLGATEQKSTKKSDPKSSHSKKDTKTNFSKKVKAIVLPKVQPVSLPKKTIPAASLTKKSTKNLDLVIQVSPTAEPVFLLAAIKSLQLAKSNLCIRVHYHSSVIKQDEAGYKFNSLLSAFDLAVNADTSRKVVSFDYVFTFLITNSLTNTDVDCCVNGAKHANVSGDATCSKFVWKMAGGDWCDECDYWSDVVSCAVNDKSQLSSVQAEVKKNFGKGKGRFCDVAVAILA